MSSPTGPTPDASAPTASTSTSASSTSTSTTPGGRGLGGAVAVMFSGTLVSRLLGFVRAAVIGVALGVAGGATDSFALANNLPNTIYMLIAGGVINAVLVPQLVRAAKEKDGGRDYTNRLLTVGGSGLLAITAVLTVAAPLLILMYGSRLGAGWLPIAYAFAYWCIPQVFFYGLYTLLGQVLNAKNVFGPYMWAPVLNNVVALAGLFVYLRIFGAMPTPILSPADFGRDRILLLGVTATLGVALQALILLVPLWRSGFRYRPAWGLKGLRSAGTMGGWTFGALLVGQISVLVITNVAAAASAQSDLDKVPYAGVYAYGLAFTIFMLPQSLVVVSLITAMFTRLSEHAASRDRAAVRATMSLSVRSVGVFTVLATTALLALAFPVAEIVTLGHQKPAAVDQIAGLVMALALGIPGLALWSVVQRVYFAYQDARTPFWIQVPMAAIVVVGTLVFRFGTRPNGWVFGACLAMAASYTIGGLVGYLGLRRRLVHLDGSRVFSTYFRLGVAAVPALLVGFIVTTLLRGFLPGGLLMALVETVVGGGLVAAVYLGLAHWLKVSEITVATNRLRGILTRLLRPVTGRLRTMEAGRGGAAQNLTGETWVLDDTVTSGMLLADRFLVEDPLPSSMSGVRAWRGRDTILERDVDILSVGGPLGEDILDGARRTALVSDPRIPRVLRVGEHAGAGYVVLEPAPTTTLADVLAAGELSEPVARSIVGEVASALEAARRRGVHHLALAPEFIALADDGGIRVTGIGVAAAASGTSMSSSAASQADADAAVALYPLMSGEPVPPEAERDLRTSSNVVVAFAPWHAIPPLEHVLDHLTSDARTPVPPAPGALRVTPDPALLAPIERAAGDDEATEHDADGADADGTEPATEATAQDRRDTDDEAAEHDEATGADADSDELAEDRAIEAELVEAATLTGGEAVASTDLALPPVSLPDDAEVAARAATGGADDEPDDAGTTSAASLAGAVAGVRGFLRRLDAIIPAEQVSPPVELEGPPAPVRDSSSWRLPVPESFEEAPDFGVVVDPEQHGPYTEADDPSVSASPPDGASLARHRSETGIAALAAWWAGRRELFDAAREARRVEAAEQAERRRIADAERAAAQAELAEARLAEAEAARAEREAAEAEAATLAAQGSYPDEPEHLDETDGYDLDADDARPEPRASASPTWAPTGTRPGPARSTAARPAGPARPARPQTGRDTEAYEVPTGRTRTWGTINATPIVLVLVLAGVLYVAYLAINSLLAPLRGDDDPASTPSSTPTPATSETGDGSGDTGDGTGDGTEGEQPAEVEQPADAATLPGPADVTDLLADPLGGSGMFPV